MTNQEVIIYLNTSLRQPEGKTGLPENIYRIRGKVLERGPDGFFIQVKAVGNEKGWQDDILPLRKIFLPHHKIDYVVQTDK